MSFKWGETRKLVSHNQMNEFKRIDFWFPDSTLTLLALSKSIRFESMMRQVKERRKSSLMLFCTKLFKTSYCPLLLSPSIIAYNRLQDPTFIPKLSKSVQRFWQKV